MVRWWGLIIEMNDENPKLAAYKNRMREFAALAGKYVTSSAEHFSAYSRLLILMGVRLNRNYNTEEEAASLMRIVCEFYESDANAAIKKEVMEYKGDMYLPFYAFLQRCRNSALGSDACDTKLNPEAIKQYQTCMPFLPNTQSHLFELFQKMFLPFQTPLLTE